MRDFLRLEFIIFVAAFAATYLGVALFRVWSLRRGYLDHPNERSSHETPTPRGGGLVIAFVTLCSYISCSWILDYRLSVGFIVGAVLIVAVSWLDDVYSLSFSWRLLVHLTAAAAVLVDVGYFDSMTIPFTDAPIYVGKFGIAISAVWIAWFVNAYNFMDGIDGIAGVQAVAAGTGWLMLGYFFAIPTVTIIGGVIVFSSIGFLIHNWQPAKIFMGDAGSAFLGFSFAAMPFLIRDQVNIASSLPIIAVLFVWLFVFDSALTLLRRLIRGERVWTAHREHLYQRLVIAGRSHSSVSVAYGVVAIIIVFATAMTINNNVSNAQQLALTAVVIVPTILLVLAARSYE